MPRKKGSKVKTYGKQRLVKPRKGKRIISATPVRGGALITEVTPRFPKKKRKK